MSTTPPNTHKSFRRRLRDTICALLCRPTCPPSPPLSPPDVTLGHEPPPSGPTLPTIPFEGDLVVESSEPGGPLTEGSSVQSLGTPNTPEDIAISAQEGTDTALEPTPTPSTPTHEVPVAALPPSSLPSVKALAPTNGTQVDDDSQGDAHDHIFETAQQHLANPASLASSIVSPSTPSTPVVLDVEDSQPSIAEQESPLTSGETQRQLYMTNVVITLNVGSDNNTLSLHLTALCPLGVGQSQEGECIPLEEISPQRWRLNKCIELPLGAHEMCFVVKDEEGSDVGFVHFEQEDVQSSGESARPFVTHNSQLSLSMSWKISHDAAQAPDPNLSQASARDILIGDLLDNPEIDPAILDRLFRFAGAHQQGGAVIGTGQDFNNEGLRLLNCFESTGRLDNINRSIVAFQRAIEVTPEGHADLPGFLSNLGSSLLHRFECTGDMADITQAITTHQQAVQLTSEGHAGMPAFLGNLGNSFLCRFERTGDMTDIAQAITTHQQAVQLTSEGHVGMPARLNNLGNSFLSRFERTGDMSDVSRAIASQQQAVQLTAEGHAELPTMLNNLSGSFLRRFQCTGDMTDITRAIASQQQAVDLTPKGHADLPARLINLGTLLFHRFGCTGDMTNITQAIASQQQAVQLIPQGHANLPGMLINLGNSFLRRFQHTGDMTDIAQAITSQQQAVLSTPQGHASLSRYLNNLGNSFFCRFNHTKNMTDITQAIASQQQAVDLTSKDHADLPGMLISLGNSFLCLFEHTGDMTVIAQAITSQQQAVQLTPQGHASLPGYLNNLGISFLCRFNRTRDMTDITQAIASQQLAVDLTPKGHLDLPGMLNNLGNSFEKRFLHAITNGIGEQHLKDVHASVGCFRAATQSISGPPTVRLQGAMRWARLLNHHNPESHEVLVPFEAAVNLLTLVAGLERTLEGRHGQLQRVSGVAVEAAAAACRLECPDKAVKWLEQGRCLVWGQLNGLRTPMDDLQEKNPELAMRLTDIAQLLETAGSSRTSVDPSMEMTAKISLEEAARSHLALAREWEDLLSAARDIPGFESFLLPSPCSAIVQGLPDLGPIVLINSHKDCCDALALLHGSNQPLHIPLPNFSLQKAIEYRRVLKTELHSHGIRVREQMGSLDKKLGGTDGRDIAQGWHDETAELLGGAAGAAVHEVLQGLWCEVAKPILDMLGYSRFDTSSNSVQPRIWWCPTGVMSFLPIHAAGIYNGTNAECLMDYVVSSYTPTVTAITDRVKSSRSIDLTVSGLFLTSQPKAPGAVEILGTTKEVDEVYAKALQNGMRAVRHEGDSISVEDCRRYMGEFSCAHLACHASQNASDPLQSRFRLHKGELSLLSLIQMNLKNADLAFLSACQTSTGEQKLSDEAVHLAAGMLAAGYRQVVATMWSISDNHAPSLATDFYDYLWNNQVSGTGDGFDASLSAHALHHAVQQLRGRLGNSGRDFLTWIPYVHFGY